MIINRLTSLRKSKRWSLQHTADKLGIAKSTYAGYESGYRRPSLEAIKEIADLFDTSVDYILGRVDQPKNNVVQQIELTELPNIEVMIDGTALTQDEIQQCIAFIRTKREFTEKK